VRKVLFSVRKINCWKCFKAARSFYGRSFKTQVYDRYSRFKRGEMSCEDHSRSGRPSICRNDENLEKVRSAINADRRRAIDEVSEITGLPWGSCQRMLTENLNMKRVSPKFVPRLLTEDKKKIVWMFVTI